MRTFLSGVFTMARRVSPPREFAFAAFHTCWFETFVRQPVSTFQAVVIKLNKKYQTVRTDRFCRVELSGCNVGSLSTFAVAV